MQFQAGAVGRRIDYLPGLLLGPLQVLGGLIVVGGIVLLAYRR